MADMLTIPRKLTERGDLVIIPRSEYEETLRIKKRLLNEEQDTDEAISIFKKEHKEGKLKRASSFSAILGKSKTRN